MGIKKIEIVLDPNVMVGDKESVKGLVFPSKIAKYYLKMIASKDTHLIDIQDSNEKIITNKELYITNEHDATPLNKTRIHSHSISLKKKTLDVFKNNNKDIVFRIHKIINKTVSSGGGGGLGIITGSYKKEVIDEKSVFYLYNSWIYKTEREYTTEEVKLMILELEDKERQKFERLKKKHSLSETVEKKPKREAIPEEVRVAVWRRDEGKCSKCGSRDRLEYDHIIPVAKGGSNTVRNIELLCEQCNRKKSANIE